MLDDYKALLSHSGWTENAGQEVWDNTSSANYGSISFSSGKYSLTLGYINSAADAISAGFEDASNYTDSAFVSSLTSYQIAAVTAATTSGGQWGNQIVDVANILFSESDVEESNIKIGTLKNTFFDEGSGEGFQDTRTAGFFVSDYDNASVFLNYDFDIFNNTYPADNQIEWQYNLPIANLAARHEILHALGLEHVPVSLADMDSQKYTIMSYNHMEGMDPSGLGNEVVPTGLQLLDIAAIQEIYGVNWTTRDENATSYDKSGAFASTHEHEAFIYTIWDGGGEHDVIDASDFDASVKIDLRQGYFSSIGNQANGDATFTWTQNSLSGTKSETVDIGNVAIAYRANIEDAIGTDENDILIGNEGDNVLTGNAGADFLYGDGAVYEGSFIAPGTISGDDTLHGGAGDDRLDGGLGNDDLYGGADNDTYVISGGLDFVYEAANEGMSDTLYLKGATYAYWDAALNMIYVNSGINGEAFITGTRSYDVTGKEVITSNVEFYTYDGVTLSDFNDLLAKNYTSFIVTELTVTTAQTYSMALEEYSYTGGSTGTTVHGANDDNAITGSSEGDILNGGGGEDHLSGSSGDDILNGGSGDDSLNGGTGDDTLNGGSGYDTLYSYRHSGSDYLNGGDDDDVYVVQLNNHADFTTTLSEDDGDGYDIVRITWGDVSLARYYGTGNEHLNLHLIGYYGHHIVLENQLGSSADFEEINVIDASYTRLVVIDGASNVNAYGSDANDIMTGLTSGGMVTSDIVRDVMYGYAGNDMLGGGAGNDSLYGGTGNDMLNGDADDDSLYGDRGEDTLNGGSGHDSLHGGNDDDTLKGGSGEDTLYGDDGDDTLEGEDDNDFMYGGNGDDVLLGGVGNDTMYGQAGDDEIYGGDGDDTISEQSGNNEIYGEAGNDNISGGSDIDIVYGGIGNDGIQGGAGNDQLHGGDGIDNIVGDDGNDEIWGDANNDILRGFAGNDKIHGGTGDDHINGGDGNDEMWGDSGRDDMYGSAGNDIYHGGDGEDYIDNRGFNGNITVYGDAGNDDLYGGDGDDIINGGDGIDLIYGMGGADQVSGGAGDDIFNIDDDDIAHGDDGDDDFYIHGTGASVYGDAGGDILRGEDAYNTSFYGGEGSDSIYAGGVQASLTAAQIATPRGRRTFYSCNIIGKA
jgi:Ca2+-binding RTX toxin-like protein